MPRPSSVVRPRGPDMMKSVAPAIARQASEDESDNLAGLCNYLSYGIVHAVMTISNTSLLTGDPLCARVAILLPLRRRTPTVAWNGSWRDRTSCSDDSFRTNLPLEPTHVLEQSLSKKILEMWQREAGRA